MSARSKELPLWLCLAVSLAAHAFVLGSARFRGAGAAGPGVRTIEVDYYQLKIVAAEEDRSSALPPEPERKALEKQVSTLAPPDIPSPVLPSSAPPAVEDAVIEVECTPLPGPTPGRDEALKSYVLNLKRQIEGEIQYPVLAFQMGMEGSVVVSFTLRRDGLLERFFIPAGGESAFAHFNQEAVRAIQGASRRFPPFPAVVDDENLTFRLPVSFVLK